MLQQRIPAQVTDVPAKSLGSTVSLPAQNAEAQNVAAQTLQETAHLQAQKMLIIEVFLIFLVKQSFD